MANDAVLKIRPGPRADELLPRSAVLIDAFCAMPDVVANGSPVVHAATALADHHLRQWMAEDASHTAHDPHSAARAKRLIDELNAERIRLIERIDQWADTEITARQGTSLHTETLGSVIDRLAIAWVRANQFTSTTAADNNTLARAALCQLAELGDAYDDLVRDIASGHRRLPSWRPLKRYGTPR